VSSITVVGSLALDSVKTPRGAVENALGGSGAYFVLAARLFVPVELVAIIGRDFPGEHLELLERHGVGLSHVERSDGETFRWGGAYGDDPNERETLFTHLNVFEGWAPELPQSLRRSPYLFLANIDPDVQANVLRQVTGTTLTVCDTMNFWIEGKRRQLVETLAGVDVCILNDGEARLLAQHYNLFHAGRAILKMGPRILVIKKGEHGALLMTEDHLFAAPSCAVWEVADPTGAGDSFAGGFLGYLAEKGTADARSLRQAVAYGTAVASFCCEKFSVDGLVDLTRARLDARVHELYELCQFELDSVAAARADSV